ncbi:MAG: preprotein translocase subunit SecA, partial [Caldilinea sp. CFX5]|nr:preprotein translocase subunit SecA [Caldilinea sp. CFX5]
MKHYPEQIQAAIALHEGNIIEMLNGEGKTLVATMPAILNALQGLTIHIATYNDYLAQRDALWMGPLYMTLQLTVGVLHGDRSSSKVIKADGQGYSLVACTRKEANACNIVYGTYQEFVFDYLRDNMVHTQENLVQSNLDYVILDEADSILIDQASTPCLVTGSVTQVNTNFYRTLMGIANQLVPDVDFILDAARKIVEFTEIGIEKSSYLLNVDSIYNVKHAGVAHQLIQSLRAIYCYKEDVDYVTVVSQGSRVDVVHIDKLTGRLALSSPFADGLQQALQVKHGASIQLPATPLATISYQHFYRLYKKLSGMTATAKWREKELFEVYGIKVIVIPPHSPFRREELPDRVFSTKKGMYAAVCNEIDEICAKGRPILVGVASVEEAETISDLLKSKQLSHNVLHAKYHAQEAAIIQAAGRKGAITISAKMAGRGTDIKLEEDAIRLGGLYVIGVERNESRHLDMQLSGRAGRHGNPGTVCFFLSLESDLMLRFGGQRISSLMHRLNVEDDVPIKAGLVTRSIKNAQRKVENHNLRNRQHVYEYDSVLDKQRQFIYELRRDVIQNKGLSYDMETVMDNVVRKAMKKFLVSRKKPQIWDEAGLGNFFCEVTDTFNLNEFIGLKNQQWDDIHEWLTGVLKVAYKRQVDALGLDQLAAQTTQQIMRWAIDNRWYKHLGYLEFLREQTSLRNHIEEENLSWYTLNSNQA